MAKKSRRQAKPPLDEATRREWRRRIDRPPDLVSELWREAYKIPPGCVATYGQLAEALGSVKGARWAAEVLLSHPHNDRCPCHRIVRADGSLGKYGGGREGEKALRLEADGVRTLEGRVDLARYGCEVVCRFKPLRQLMEWQIEAAGNARQAPLAEPPRLVAGLDVSYRGADAVAACVVCDMATGDKVSEYVNTRRAVFPYISTFLAFREAPALLSLWDGARCAGHHADVVMVDGSGMLHPRRGGVATLFGLLADVPTIGVTKTHLCGTMGSPPSYGSDATIELEGEAIGTAIVVRPSGNKTIYVSPGHEVTLAEATRITHQMLRGRALPEPIYWADRLSRAEAKKGREEDEPEG